jgi:hypothetical protein
MDLLSEPILSIRRIVKPTQSFTKIVPPLDMHNCVRVSDLSLNGINVVESLMLELPCLPSTTILSISSDAMNAVVGDA